MIPLPGGGHPAGGATIFSLILAVAASHRHERDFPGLTPEHFNAVTSKPYCGVPLLDEFIAFFDDGLPPAESIQDTRAFIRVCSRDIAGSLNYQEVYLPDNVNDAVLDQAKERFALLVKTYKGLIRTRSLLKDVGKNSGVFVRKILTDRHALDTLVVRVEKERNLLTSKFGLQPRDFLL